MGDSNRGEAAAIIEDAISNARHTLRNVDGGEAGAIFESTDSNARHTLRNVDGGKAGATIESPVSNARQALWNGDASEATTRESISPNTRHASGDDKVGYQLSVQV